MLCLAHTELSFNSVCIAFGFIVVFNNIDTQDFAIASCSIRIDKSRAVPSIRFRSQQESDDTLTLRKKSQQVLDARKKRSLIRTALASTSAEWVIQSLLSYFLLLIFSKILLTLSLDKPKCCKGFSYSRQQQADQHIEEQQKLKVLVGRKRKIETNKVVYRADQHCVGKWNKYNSFVAQKINFYNYFDMLYLIEANDNCYVELGTLFGWDEAFLSYNTSFTSYHVVILIITLGTTTEIYKVRCHRRSKPVQTDLQDVNKAITLVERYYLTLKINLYFTVTFSKMHKKPICCLRVTLYTNLIDNHLQLNTTATNCDELSKLISL